MLFYLYWLNIDDTLSKVLDKQKCHEYRANYDAAKDLAAHHISLEGPHGYDTILVLPDANLHGTRKTKA